MQWPHPQQRTPLKYGTPNNDYCREQTCDTRLIYRANNVETTLDTSSASLISDPSVCAAQTGLELKFPGLSYPLSTNHFGPDCVFDNVRFQPFCAGKEAGTGKTMVELGSTPQIMGLGLGKGEWAQASVMARAQKGSRRFAFLQTDKNKAVMCFGSGCQYKKEGPPEGAQRFDMLDTVCGDDKSCLLHNAETNKLRYPAAEVEAGAKVVFDTGANVDSMVLDKTRNIRLNGLKNFEYLYVDYDNNVVDVRFKRRS